MRLMDEQQDHGALSDINGAWGYKCDSCGKIWYTQEMNNPLLFGLCWHCLYEQAVKQQESYHFYIMGKFKEKQDRGNPFIDKKEDIENEK